jgi:hypothetical protein
VSLESLGEHPAFLAIAREVPSFAGFWFDDNDAIVVATTDLRDFPRITGLIPQYLGAHQPAGGYVALKVDRSFEHLARLRASLRTEVLRTPGVVSLGIKESANRIDVGVVSDGIGASVRAIARSRGVADEELNIRTVPVPTTTSHTLQSQHPSGRIEGGWQISSAAGTCTLGFPAYRADGTAVFVTNSHCTSTTYGPDGGTIHQPANPNSIGTELLDPAGWSCSGNTCRHSDAALISASVSMEFGKIARTTERVTSDVSGGALTINHSYPSFTISGKHRFVYENETLEKVGRTTGWSAGAVEDTCTDHNVGGFVRLCADRVDYAAQGGDSGSPVFFMKADGTVELRGIHWGWQGGTISDALMSNLYQIELDLGSLSVHALIATIQGPTLVLQYSSNTWTAGITGGKPPYTYVWRRDGTVVSTSSSYSGSVDTSDFELSLTITDALGTVSAYTVTIDVWDSPCPPPQISC